MATTQSLILLTVTVFVFSAYTFINANWSPSVGNPPANNTDAPVNTSTTTQSKAGNFMANIVAAATSTWSPRYCDALGNNCFTATSTVGGGGITQLTAGPGILLTPTTITTTGTIAINTSFTQQRVTGSCPAGQAIRQINADGTVVCQTDAAICIRNGAQYSQGARCRVSTSGSSCASGSANHVYQECSASGAWVQGSTGCTFSPSPAMSCP